MAGVSIVSSDVRALTRTKAVPQRAVDVFLRYLKAEGVRVVFGIPGGLLFPFFEAIEEDDEFELVVAKHEEGAAFMADGYARLTRRLAVCAGTSGPGATNLLTGVACAFADGVPMLVVTGQAATHALGRGAAQETPREDIDIVAMFQPVTKYSAMVTAAADLPRHLRRALRQALSGRPGPVHLNLPVDLWEQALSEDWFEPRTYRPETASFDRVPLQQATEALMRARFPLLLAGSGVAISGAEEHLRTLAELLQARVVTTPRAKGVFPEDHPLSLGVMGFAGHEEATATAFGDDIDVLFTVGASLNETTTMNWDPRLRPSQALIQLDIDPERIARNYPVDVALVADAQTALVELTYHVHRAIRQGEQPASEWHSQPAPKRGHERHMFPDLRQADSSPLTPQRWRVELEQVLPSDAIVFSDIGGHMLFNVHDLTIREGQRFVLNLGFGSMGHGTVAPIGAALACPDRPIVAIVGDACFTMNGMELLTAVEYQVPVLWIVENNNMHGITWHGSRALSRRGKALSSVRYRERLDVAALCRAMGLSAWVVDAPETLGDCVRRALAQRLPAVIEVRVDGSIAPPLGGRVRSLAGFIQR